MVKVLAMECTKKLNFFPPKGGVSKFYSPRMLLHQENIDYNKHCAYSFGMYVQADQENDPTNTQQARAIDCIYLRFLSNKQGGHELLNLNTGRRITCQKVTPVPITNHVINLVHKMADNDGMPDGLKIQNQQGVVLYDSSWIAGVDYKEDEDYEEQDDEDDNDDYLEEEYDKVDPNELADILEDNEELIANNANPVEVEEDEAEDAKSVEVEDEEQQDDEQSEDEEEVEGGTDDEHQAPTTQSGRTSKPPE